MRRVLLYAALYGALGASVGVMIALYTNDPAVTKAVLEKYGIKSEEVVENG